MAGLIQGVLLVKLLSSDNQTDSKDIIVKFIQRFVKPLLYFGVQVFLITLEYRSPLTIDCIDENINYICNTSLSSHEKDFPEL